MGSGTALMIAMFIPCLKMRSASRLLTSCFINDVQLSRPGLPTVLWEVICDDVTVCGLASNMQAKAFGNNP